MAERKTFNELLKDSKLAENMTIDALIEKDGSVITHFAGRSMYPMLRSPKDLVLVEKVNRPLRKNDVPLYRMSSGKLLLHRIIKIKNGQYIIRGDNRLEKEYNITDQMIIGVLKGFYRDRKYVDCESSKSYKLYVFVINNTFALRWLWHKYFKRILLFVKRKITGR